MTGAGYQGYRDWKTWDSGEFGRSHPGDAAVFQEELRRAGAVDLKGKRILELGFGNGSFAGWALGRGAEVLGTELIPELRDLAVKAGVRVLDASSPLAPQAEPGTVDIAVAFDVFEHIEPGQIQSLLEDLRACLRPGGFILARVPSGDSPFSGAIQHGDLTHRACLGSSAVRQIAAAGGFADVEVREPALPLQGAGCAGSFRRLLVRSARRILFPVIARLFMGGGTPILTPNLIFVLRRS